MYKHQAYTNQIGLYKHQAYINQLGCYTHQAYTNQIGCYKHQAYTSQIGCNKHQAYTNQIGCYKHQAYTNQIGCYKHQAYTNQIGLYKLPQVSTWFAPGSDQIQTYFLFNFRTPKYCKKKEKITKVRLNMKSLLKCRKNKNESICRYRKVDVCETYM